MNTFSGTTYGRMEFVSPPGVVASACSPSDWEACGGGWSERRSPGWCLAVETERPGQAWRRQGIGAGVSSGTWSHNEGRTAQGRKAAGRSPRVMTVAG
ncbi:unnamed protein product [Litomosoides sigmodontis]|uniref:Uncharacterized protein n=1 Tax=Litomosoides sigmodontis TaxID=42156 RepID=A0A3P6TT12_LITSI|nr:unnamed protein product [Litomosoides sigmodontis]